MAGILDIFDSMGNGFNQFVDTILPDEEGKLNQKEVQKNAPKPSVKNVSSNSSGLSSSSEGTGETDYGKMLGSAGGFLSGIGSALKGDTKALFPGFETEQNKTKLSMNPIHGLKNVAQTVDSVSKGDSVNPRAVQQEAENYDVPPLLKATEEQMAERNKSPEERAQKQYSDTIARLESSNNPKSVNELGYSGKYQMGTLAMKDLGIINKESSNRNSSMKDEKSYIKNKYGITSQEQFLNDEKLQDRVFKDWNNVLTRQLKSKGALKYVGKEVNGIKITKNKILAASHMLGAGAVSKALRNGTLDTLVDGNQNSALNRMNEVDS